VAGANGAASFVVLDLQKTLEENGIRDESAESESLGMNEDQFLPCLHVYFNDDLTYA
jgi:hypothetical protein